MYKQEVLSSIQTLNSEFSTMLEINEYYEQAVKSSSLSVKRVGLKELENWDFSNSGSFEHESGRFFSVNSVTYNGHKSLILNQPEVGVLATFMTILNGISYFLIQLKEEPGNINKVQLSPTIQATKSNYSKVHGGNLPNYWEEYLNFSDKSSFISSKLPEQGTRYWKKFNSNEIILTPMFEEDKNFKWLTLGQILELRKNSNSINSCLRSNLSLMYEFICENIKDIDFMNKFEKIKSISNQKQSKFLHEATLFDDTTQFYNQTEDCLSIESEFDTFKINGALVQSESREVVSWSQPLINEKLGQEYYLFRTFKDGETKYIWSIDFEPGSKSGLILGPSIKKIPFNNVFNLQIKYFNKASLKEEYIMSEEGGRFNRFEVKHLIFDINYEDIDIENLNILLLNKSETNSLNKNGLLSMEARSLFFFSLGADLLK